MAKDQDVAVDPEVLRLMQEIETLRQELGAMGRRLAEAERLADHDVLTPLLNRRAFVREMQRAIALTRRYDIPASVIYFDLDDFKGVNDRYGHAAGDAVLIAVAERLLAHVREADAVGRIGGDEFAVLLQHADFTAAQAKAVGPGRGGIGTPGGGRRRGHPRVAHLGRAPDRGGGLSRTVPLGGRRRHVPEEAAEERLGGLAVVIAVELAPEAEPSIERLGRRVVGLDLQPRRPRALPCAPGHEGRPSTARPRRDRANQGSVATASRHSQPSLAAA